MVQRSVADKLALLGQHDDGAPWTRISTESGVALRTLSRWWAQYRTDPTSHGLERSRRSDHHGRRIAAELVEATEALALRRPEPTTAFIHRRVGDIATDRGLMPPSYSSVRAIMGAIVRITGGNFSLVDRLTAQIQRVQTVNCFPGAGTRDRRYRGQALLHRPLGAAKITPFTVAIHTLPPQRLLPCLATPCPKQKH